jgi:RNA polymerase sigma-70 factor (sigma-E family)
VGANALRGVSSRDQEFTRYVEARGGVLLRTAVFLCAGDRSGAEDLVQATLVRAYVAWHRVRDEGARDAYVRRIMVRESYRRPVRVVPVLAEPEQPDGHTSVEDRMDLFPLLAALPRQQRAVVVLRYYEDLSEREIADALGCSPGAVKRHASRALSALRARLGDPHPSEGGADRGHRR